MANCISVILLNYIGKLNFAALDFKVALTAHPIDFD